MDSVYSMHELTKTLNKLAGFEKEYDDFDEDDEEFQDDDLDD